MKHLTAIFFISLLFIIAAGAVSCWGFYAKPYAYSNQQRWAWKPVYAIDTSYRVISYAVDTPVVNAGNIYIKDNFIYQCEVGSGIHVTDNADPATAKRIGFIKVPGCEQISIKGNILYTNNYYDLVAIDISNLVEPKIVSRTKNAFFGDSNSPHTWEEPKDTGYYQCPNYYTDSVIVNWVKDSVFAYCHK